MTYGALRMRLKKLAPGVDLELIDGWIQDRYTKILDKVPHKRLEAEIVIQAPLSYATGTIAVTQGDATITGTGTSWTAAMSGLAIRIAAQEEYYQLTVTNGTSAELDRPYERADATGQTYRIDQPVYVMPATCRIIRAVAPLHDRLDNLEIVTPYELDRISISRNSYGTPKYAAPHWDNFSDPPRMQLELYPIPQSPTSQGAVPSWAVDMIQDAPSFDPEVTSANVLPWVRPAALVAGCLSDVNLHLKDFQAMALYKTQFDEALMEMLQTNALQRGPQQIKLARELRRKVPGLGGRRSVSWERSTSEE